MIKYLQHTIIALLIQGGVWLIAGDLWLGALLAIGFYAGREHSQAEYRYMDIRNCNRSAMPFYGGFTKEAWNLDSFINDFLTPSIAVCAVAFYF